MKNEKLRRILDRSVFPFVTKPGRYLGNEINTIIKDPASVEVRFAIAFPEVYEIGMSSQAVGILYHQLNSIPEVQAERVFAPWTDMHERMTSLQVPLYSLETFTPLREFDLIGFTLQYELTYTNILTMLDMSAIPLRSADRGEEDPIIMAGGPVSCNPEPLAAFVDVFYIGDAEEGINEFIGTYQQARAEGLNREAILTRLAALRGVYVPAFYRAEYDAGGEFSALIPMRPEAQPVIRTRITPELKAEYYPEKPLVPLIEVTHNRIAVEVMRGCTEGCRYCNAGMIYRPTRERSDEEIVEYSKRVMENTGFEELSFLSLSISDYSALNELMRKEREALEGMQVNVSFPSMRLDSFSEEIAEFARSVRKSGFTFAPEAGSDRLRKVINKNISDDDLMNALNIALENGWKQIKFYFMIGLPTETKEDVEAIANLVERSVRLSKKYGRIQFNVSISPHSPKSHTPFQWERQDTKEELMEKTTLLRDRFKRLREVNFSWRDPRVSEIESVLGRGDRRFADVIFGAWKKGAMFDGWDEQFRYDAWIEAFEEAGVPIQRYLREIPESLPLPWEHIDKGVTRNFLSRERKNAYKEVNIIDCKDGTCFGCGIQRKDAFREYAECYTDLRLHRIEEPAEAAKSQQQPAKPSQVKKEPVKEQPVETTAWRMRFKKDGYARYLSHLDVMRAFDRACRKEKLPVAYSEGFNPRPKMSFCSPLSLGYTSEAEYMDIEFYAGPPEGWSEKLSRSLPDGLEILESGRITTKVNSLSAAINQAEYRVSLENADAGVSDEDIRKLLDKESVPVKRTVKGKVKDVDIRPYIMALERVNRQLLIRTCNIEGRTTRIEEVLRQFFPENNEAVSQLSVHRKSQLISDNASVISPMQVI